MAELINAPSLIPAANDIIRTTPSSTFEFNSTISSDCISFIIIDDDIIEGRESFNITLMPTDGVVFVDDRVTIVITDNDSKTCIDVEC